MDEVNVNKAGLQLLFENRNSNDYSTSAENNINMTYTLKNRKHLVQLFDSVLSTSTLFFPLYICNKA